MRGILFGIPVLCHSYKRLWRHHQLKGFFDFYRIQRFIFQSQESYLKIDEVKRTLIKMPSAIITVNYNGIMFALTMETHVGIVSIKSTSNYKNEAVYEDENTSDLLKDIVWYEEQTFHFLKKKYLCWFSQN